MIKCVDRGDYPLDEVPAQRAVGSHPDPFDQLTRWIEEFINLENIEPILTQNIEN